MNPDYVIPTDRSADLTTFTFRVDGEAVPPTVNVMAIAVYSELNRIPSARITVLDGDPALQDFPSSNLAIFAPGKEIEILAGYHSVEKTIFKGVIVKHSLKVRDHCFQLILDCRDPAFRMTLARRSRSFHDLKDSEVMENMLNEYGLTPSVKATKKTKAEITQYDVSDWDFLQVRAEANGMVCLVDGGTVTIEPPKLSQSPVVSPVFGSSIIEFDVETDGRQQFDAVKATAWDFVNQEMAESSGAEPSVPQAGQDDGPTISADMQSGEYVLRHAGRGQTDDLQVWADAVLLRQRLAKIRGRVVFQGMHGVKPGTIIELVGVGERFSGKVYVSGVHHRIEGGNWHLHVQFGLNPEPFAEVYNNLPPLRAGGRFGPVNGLAIGVVTQLADDPDNAERIRVQLPMLTEGGQGIWARQASLDAGKDRGAFFRPEIGDEVVVGFLNDDPNDAVVLGMLNSPDKPAPFPTDDDNHKKGFITRSKLELVFDDDKKTVTIKTPKGKTILLDDDGSLLTLEDENGNKIEFAAAGITIESSGNKIEFASAGITIESKGNLTLKAGGNAELKGTGTTTVKGATVMIN